MNKRSKLFGLLVVMVIGAGLCVYQPAFADNDENENSGTLLKALPQAKISLADGIKQATKGKEAPISAKFEMDDKGKLSLSVYTAEKGLKMSAEKNAFKEVSGSPESSSWKPESEVIKDEKDLASAKEQLAVLSKAKVSLLDIVKKAGKDYPGTVFDIHPEEEGGKSVCEVRVVKDGTISEHHYDVATGKEVKMAE